MFDIQVGASSLKRAVGRAAIAFVSPGEIIGVGTGSTVAHFIEALGDMRDPIAGAVSSSERSTAALKALGIPVLDANDVDQISAYVDGADEIDPCGCMVKGGGGALTREKIVAALAQRFICIVDESKAVDILGAFPVPVEVVPSAAALVARRFTAGEAGSHARTRLRLDGDGTAFVTDNGQHILDVWGLRITDPMEFESTVSCWPGVLTVGVFARQRASTCLLATSDGVRALDFM